LLPSGPGRVRRRLLAWFLTGQGQVSMIRGERQGVFLIPLTEARREEESTNYTNEHELNGI